MNKTKVFFARLALIIFVVLLIAVLYGFMVSGLSMSGILIGNFLFYTSIGLFSIGALWYMAEFGKFKKKTQRTPIDEEVETKTVDNDIYGFCYAFLLSGVILYGLSYMLSV